MHIALVVYDDLDVQSGGYRYDRQLVAYLRDHGDDVEVIALPRRGPLGTARATLSRAVRRTLDRPVDILLQDALCADVLWRHNRQLTTPDAVVGIVHLLRSANGASTYRLPWRSLERRYLRTLDGAICPSVATRTAIRDLAPVSTSVAYPAGRHDGPVTDAATVRSRASSDPLEIAFVGNLVPRKGLVTLLEALECLHGDWRATIVGSQNADPGHARTVRRKVDRHAASSHIEMLGEVSDDRLDTILDQAHILAVPSRRESFGMVYAEAMEFGTVPIATTVGGAPEFVIDGYNGRLVPPDDPAVLQNVLQELSTDRERLADLSEGALETIGQHDTWEDSMARVRQFLRARIDAGVAEPPMVTKPVERMSATAINGPPVDDAETAGPSASGDEGR